MDDGIKLLNKYQPLIFWLELAGLLHDIGKLQNAFIEYRKTWQKEGGKDPHASDFLGTSPEEADPKLKDKSFKDLRTLFQESFANLSGFVEITLPPSENKMQIGKSIADLVKFHIHPPKNSELAQMLHASDSKDSAEDRNNPLLVNEQSSEPTIFKSSVFGYETSIPMNLDDLRSTLYQSLQALLINSSLQEALLVNRTNKPTSELRKEVHKVIREAFCQAVSDTCRPANDIVLWEHSYATATLFKVLIAHFILYGEKILKRDDVRFSLWGVGWDGLAFYSSGHRIGDIVGRKALIQDLKGKIREKMEWDFGLGNAIYDDDNGVYFIMPEVQEGKGAWINEVECAIREANETITKDELPIFFSQPKNTKLMVPIVAVIDEVRRSSAFPWHLGSDENQGSGEIQKLKWVTDWTPDKGAEEVCPICRKRPVPSMSTICKGCEDIRKRKPKSMTTDPLEPMETVYHSEIALDKKEQSGKLALIVARFDLKKWLDGTMLYTLFVKEARSFEAALRHLGKINDEDIKLADDERIKILESRGVDRNNFNFDYKEIKSKIALCQMTKAFLYLFDRHSVNIPDWGYIEHIRNDLKNLNLGKDEFIVNYLATKNHSPSRLLRIWNGTRDFLIEQSRQLRERCRDKKGRIRLKVSGNAPEKTILKGDARLSDQSTIPVEVVKEGDSVILINRRFDSTEDWNGATLDLTVEEFRKGKQNYSLTVTGVLQEDVVRARTITASPDLFLAVVPAGRAIELCDLIHKNYQREFGKVYGRLPFSMGILYFSPQMPMFVALDGAKRMINNFDRLSSTCEKATIHKIDKTSENGAIHISLKPDSQNREIDLSLPVALGNRDKDYFHPYLLIENSEGVSKRKSYFETPVGNIVHYLDLEAGDRIDFYPNFFDFEFIDSTTRRFDLSDFSMNNKKRCSGPNRRQTRPILLDELDQGIECLWKTLKGYEGMTDSKLRNLASLFHTWEIWRTEEDGNNIYNSFIQTALKKELPNIDLPSIVSLLREGLFFDVLELHLEILKERIGK